MNKKRGLTSIGDILSPKLLKSLRGPSAIEKRLIETAAAQAERPSDPREILYQHTVFCQTALPYRNEGDETRVWERSNGDVHLMVKAGHAMGHQTALEGLKRKVFPSRASIKRVRDAWRTVVKGRL